MFVLWAGTLAYVAACHILRYVIVFSGMRVLALSGGKWPLSVIVFLFGVVPVGTNSVSVEIQFADG